MKKKLKKTKEVSKHLFDDSFKQISPLGSYQFFAIIVIMFFLTKQYNEFSFLIIGFFVISSFAIPIRLIFFRERPDKTTYNNDIEKIHAASFPSLHSSRAMFLVLFFINYFEKDFLITLFISILGFLVVYGRIYRNRHYPSDVSAGIAFGVIVYLILNYFL